MERPEKTPDGREVREFKPRSTRRGGIERNIENEVIEEQREMKESQRRLLSPLKVPDSIEKRLLSSKLQNDGKE